MTQKGIKKIFGMFFNNMPNPIFCNPCLYFKHKDFLCEVARTRGFEETKLSQKIHAYINPLDVLELLLVDDGFYITVLERKSREEFVHRTDLCGHIDSKNEITKFINKLN